MEDADRGRSTGRSLDGIRWSQDGIRSVLQDGGRKARSVLHDGGRSSRTESGPEPDSRARGRSPVRSPIPRSQDGVCSVLRFRPPGWRTELVQSPSSVLQDGFFLSSVLQDGGQNFEDGVVLQSDARTEPSPSPCMHGGGV
eukprot:gene12166-biopygen3320